MSLSLTILFYSIPAPISFSANPNIFLALITNVLPFLGKSNSFGLISVGMLTIIGLILYQAEDMNAFATGMRRDSSLVAVSSGLLPTVASSTDTVTANSD